MTPNELHKERMEATLKYNEKIREQRDKPVCDNCGCPEPKKIYDGWWCDWCDNEM